MNVNNIVKNYKILYFYQKTIRVNNTEKTLMRIYPEFSDTIKNSGNRESKQ